MAMNVFFGQERRALPPRSWRAPRRSATRPLASAIPCAFRKTARSRFWRPPRFKRPESEPPAPVPRSNHGSSRHHRAPPWFHPVRPRRRKYRHGCRAPKGGTDSDRGPDSQAAKLPCALGIPPPGRRRPTIPLNPPSPAARPRLAGGDQRPFLDGPPPPWAATCKPGPPQHEHKGQRGLCCRRNKMAGGSAILTSCLAPEPPAPLEHRGPCFPPNMGGPLRSVPPWPRRGLPPWVCRRPPPRTPGFPGNKAESQSPTMESPRRPESRLKRPDPRGAPRSGKGCPLGLEQPDQGLRNAADPRPPGLAL